MASGWREEDGVGDACAWLRENIIKLIKRSEPRTKRQRHKHKPARLSTTNNSLTNTRHPLRVTCGRGRRRI
jgi:hypothetical protein